MGMTIPLEVEQGSLSDVDCDQFVGALYLRLRKVYRNAEVRLTVGNGGRCVIWGKGFDMKEVERDIRSIEKAVFEEICSTV